MTTLRHCHIHGSFRADYPDSCPSCQLDEFVRDDRAEASAKAREASETYKRNNPGDYTCPNCLYVTLRSGASRCPKCQGTVNADYWVRVRADEKATALADQERKAEEAAEQARRRLAEAEAAADWVRRAPEREAAARANAAEALRQRRAKAAAKVFWGLMIPVSWFVGGYAGWAIAHVLFDNGILQVLLGVVFAGVGAIVTQGIPYYLMEKA